MLSQQVWSSAPRLVGRLPPSTQGTGRKERKCAQVFVVGLGLHSCLCGFSSSERALLSHAGGTGADGVPLPPTLQPAQEHLQAGKGVLAFISPSSWALALSFLHHSCKGQWGALAAGESMAGDTKVRAVFFIFGVIISA